MPLPASLIERDKKTAETLGRLAKATTLRLLPNLEGLSQGEAAGVARTVALTVSTQVGNAATVAATQSYQNMSVAAIDELIAQSYARGERGSARIELSLARGAALQREFYQAEPIKVKRVVDIHVEGVIGNTMDKYTRGLYPDAETALASGVGRMVQNIYRDTMVSNSQKDKKATGYQRVASPKACSFCLLVALNEYTTFEESGGYHDSCGCSAVPVFKSTGAYKPDYYDGFRADYEKAFSSVNSSKAEDILTALRLVTGRP
jgi:hypothetical protein